MDNAFFAYLDRLTLMVFFSGYPLVYAFVSFLATSQQQVNFFKRKALSILPYGYGLAGILYLGYRLQNLYPDYSPANLGQLAGSYLQAWGLLSLIFLIPAIARRRILSLLHSFVFFFYLIKDLVGSSADKESVRNDMKLYSISLLINLGTFLVILLLSFLFSRFRHKGGANA